MARWQLNYGVNYKAKGEDRLKANITSKGGNGIQLVMGGGIPEIPGVDVKTIVEGLVEKHLVGLEDLPAKDLKSHVKCLEAISAYSLELAATLKQAE